MLVLSRRSRQSVFIGGQVKITVLTISPKQVQLGIEAPPQVAVDREEVHLRKQAQLTEPATDTVPL
jgi:carbon storage regulator